MTATLAPFGAPAVLYAIREAVPADYGFLVEGTAKVRWPHSVPWWRWDATERPRLLAILREGSAFVAGAGGGLVLGFVIVDARRAVEMLYVKRDFRGVGLGRDLLTAAGLGPPLLAREPTASWRRWCAYHRLDWRLV